MGRPEDERDFDETTVTGSDEQAWSAVDRPTEQPPIAGDAPPVGYAGAAWQPRPGESADPDADETVVIDGSWTAPDDAMAPEPAGGVVGPAGEVVEPGGGRPGAGDVVAGSAPTGDEPAKTTDAGAAKPAKRRRRAGRQRKEPVIPPGPVLTAAGLGLLTAAGWVFKDIDLTLRPSSVAAIVGPAGTGRSSLLLALTGRLAANTGTLTVAGHAVKDNPAAVRAITAVARISATIGPEPGLTVRQSIGERCLIDDVDTRVGRARFDEACAAMQLKFEPTALVGSMVGDQATLLAVALACVRVSALLVLDDLDRGVSTAVQQTMLDALLRLSKTGPTVVLSTTDRIPVMGADVVLDLTPSEGAAMWRLDLEAPPGPQRRELDQMSDADRARLEIESAPDLREQSSGDPYARWKPDYPGDAGEQGEAGADGPADPYAAPDEQGPTDIYGPTDVSAAGGDGDPGRPDDSNQRDAPTEDSR